MRTAITLLALAALATAVALWRADASWTAATQDMERRLRSQAARSGASVYREAELSGLPPPVARYFRAALRDGQPIVNARVSGRGEFNTGQPGKAAWKPFTAYSFMVSICPTMHSS